MMKLCWCILVFCAASPCLAISQLELWSLLTSDDSIWNCATTLNDACVDALAKKPVQQLFEARELHIGKHFTIEKVASRSATEGRGDLSNIWDMDELIQTGAEFLSTHVFKLRLGQLEARMMPSKKPDSVELVVEARGRARDQRLYRVILPLIVGFKITGMVIFGIVTVKLFLLKAGLVANTALMLAGGIVIKKLYDHGMGMINQHHAILNSHMPLPNYYSNNHDFSGYGINSYSNSHGLGSGFDTASSIHSDVSEPVSVHGELGDLGDLHGGFSNHAIALAALNKTLLQHNHHSSATAAASASAPKRRWGHHKWSPWQTSF